MYRYINWEQILKELLPNDCALQFMVQESELICLDIGKNGIIIAKEVDNNYEDLCRKACIVMFGLGINYCEDATNKLLKSL